MKKIALLSKSHSVACPICKWIITMGLQLLRGFKLHVIVPVVKIQLDIYIYWYNPYVNCIIIHVVVII